MKAFLYKLLFFISITIGGVLVYIGIRMGDIEEVWRNAVLICLSCIGIE